MTIHPIISSTACVSKAWYTPQRLCMKVLWQFNISPSSPHYFQVPFTTMLALLCMWFGISMPLVYLGYYFGFRKQPYDNPVRTNQIPRQVPEQRWYMNKFVGWASPITRYLHRRFCLHTVEPELKSVRFFFFFPFTLESWWPGSCRSEPCSSSCSSFSV